MSSEPDKPKRWRPWQFSLRTLMTLMLAVACFLGGWMANDWHRERQMQLDEVALGPRTMIGNVYTLTLQPDPPEFWWQSLWQSLWQELSLSNILLLSVIVALFAKWQLDRVTLKRRAPDSDAEGQ